jgi:hypothetical protein
MGLQNFQNNTKKQLMDEEISAKMTEERLMDEFFIASETKITG